MKHFGNTMVLWDLKAMQPRRIFSVPGRPAGDPLVAESEGQLGDHRHRADVQALADPARRQRRVARYGGGHDR